ncbi:MAG: hypothetical protein LBL49_01015 [Clostridiales Family XIII bacterium]|jgi:hypothetical protein|nr:hypothetical protein [Clostridiales Family XIII bacterium]
MKKKILFTLVIAMLFSPMSAFAAAPNTLDAAGNEPSFSDETTVIPYFTVIGSLAYALTFSGGKANCSIEVNVSQSKADKVAFQVTLYKKVGLGWQSVTSWDKTVSVSSSSLARFSQSASVSSGNTYRLAFSATVYKSSTVVETINYTTPEQSN